jgi:putative transposase
MRDVIYLLFHLLTTLAKLIGPGGNRTVIAKNLLLKQQLISHHHQTFYFAPVSQCAEEAKVSDVIFTRRWAVGGGRRPGPKGPSAEVINAIVEMERRNPRYGCPRIAQQINLAFGLDMDKDRGGRHISAQITTLSFNTTGGKPI